MCIQTWSLLEKVDGPLVDMFTSAVSRQCSLASARN
jgi:hypothetical protein